MTDPSAIDRRCWWPWATQSSLDVSDNCVFYLRHFRDQHIRALSLQNPFLKLWIIFATEAVRYRRRPVLLALLHIGPFLANPKDSLRSIWSNLFRHHGAKTGMRYRYACFFFCLDAWHGSTTEKQWDIATWCTPLLWMCAAWDCLNPVYLMVRLNLCYLCTLTDTYTSYVNLYPTYFII